MGLVLNYRETLKSSGRNIWKLKQLILYYSFKNAEAVLIVNKMTSTSQEKMQLSKHKVILADYKNTALKVDRNKEELNLKWAEQAEEMISVTAASKGVGEMVARNQKLVNI